MTDLSKFCDQINKDQKKHMTKSDIHDWLGGFGCLGIILICLAIFLLVIPIVLFIGATITGGLIWIGWNLALVPIFGLVPITMWWQAFGLGLLVTVVSSALKGIVVKKGD
jgi:hypothetical protein